MFSKYKLFIILGLLAAYSLGVWHVASTYTESSIYKDKLSEAVAALEQNKKLSGELQQGLRDYFAKAKPITKEIQRETITNNIYSDCKSTDGVMRGYQDKLNAQP